MRNKHQEALKKSVVLGYASQTSWLMQNVHDKCQNLPDPDICTFDRQGQRDIRGERDNQCDSLSKNVPTPELSCRFAATEDL